MVWKGFCTVREHSKVIFCWIHFSNLCSIGVDTEKNYFSKKKLEKFEIVEWSELDFAL